MSREEQLAGAMEFETRISELCACGHSLRMHHHAKSCTATDANLKFCKCEQFRIARAVSKQFNSEESAQLTEGVVNVMAKEKKGRKLVLFEVTSKKAEELLAKDNQTNAAIFYRVLVAAEKPMQRLAIYEASKSKCESGAAWERLGNQTHDTLARLRKAGFVKRIETREAVEAKPARAAKPKAERKPRAAKKASKANGAEKRDVGDNDIPKNDVGDNDIPKNDVGDNDIPKNEGATA